MKKLLKVPPPRSSPPETIGRGRFKIVRQIGEGAAGTVYEALQVSVDRRVAIKVLQRMHQAQDDYKERFSREAKAIARLNHTHCITLFDFGYSEEFDSLFMVTEFVEGRELFDVLADGGLPLRESLRIALQLTEALAHAHDQGILHRDLKPENVLIATNGDAKVLDFGLVRILDKLQSEQGRRLTAQGAVYGTPVYMSPEQCQGDIDVSERTDLYSLGVMLYEMIEGQLPFDSREILKILAMHVQEPVPPMTANAPDALKQLIMQMLEKNPEDRPRSAHEVADRIRDILLGAAIDAGEFSADISQELSRSIMRRAKKPTPAKQTEPIAEAPLVSRAPEGFRPATLQLVGLSLGGQYHIGSVLGAGAMGTVFKAVTDDGESVAVKVVGHGTTETLRATEEFKRESEILRQLDGPHVVKLLDVGHDDSLDRDYVVMEFVDGEPLQVRLNRGPLSASDVGNIAEQALEALVAAHAVGVVHRDLKPANIMLAAGATIDVRVLGFGLALLVDQTRLTATGDAVSYLPPEVLQGKPVDPRADLYGLGTILYEALTGSPAFNGADPTTQAANILTLSPTPIEELAPETSGELAAFVERLMNRDPEQRPKTAQAALTSLRALTSTAAETASTPVYDDEDIDFGGRSPWWLIPAGILVIVSAVIALIVFGPADRKAPAGTPTPSATTPDSAIKQPIPPVEKQVTEPVAQADSGPDSAAQGELDTPPGKPATGEIQHRKDPKGHAENPKAPAEKPKAPAEKPKLPAEKPKAPAERPKALVEKPQREPPAAEDPKKDLPTLEFTP